LIAEGRNICTTHALFTMLTREIYDLLRERNYTLIIDEVVTCVDLLRSLKPADRKMLFDGDYVRIGDRNHLVWNHERYPDYSGRFDDIRNLCNNGNLVAYGQNPKTGFPTEPGSMDSTYDVAVPFVLADDGVAAGEAVECLSANAAVMRAEALSRKPARSAAAGIPRSASSATPS
jgi:hypothetical protein